MRVTHGPYSALRGAARAALTIGNFDGVHRGHQAMLERLRDGARERSLRSTVLTFEPHPREFFAPESAPARLTALPAKLALLEAHGVEHTHVERFDTQFAALSPERFVADVAVGALGCAWLLVGRDFRYGARRAGDYASLEAAAGRCGFVLEPMPEVLDGGERISSSAVRAALAAGDLERAQALLGRPYAISGRVAKGDALGRQLGFPTANIALEGELAALRGIFVVEVEGVDGMDGVARGRRWPGVASIGVRPTVKEGAPPLLEVHLFDFEGELYGRELRVDFLAKLREEEKYEGLGALREAIARDVARARDYFAMREHG